MVMGTSAWMEHPIPAHWEPRAPPSWDWRPLMALAASPAVSTIDIDQCQFQPSDRPLGEFGQAPTRIMSLRLPSLPGLLQSRPNRGKCNHPRGAHRTLLGKDASAKFHTSDKKTYPSALCLCLAQAMYNDVILPFIQDPYDLPEAAAPNILAPLLRFSASLSSDFWVGPDFADPQAKPKRPKVDNELDRYRRLLAPSAAGRGGAEAPSHAPGEAAAAADPEDSDAEQEAAAFLGHRPVFPSTLPPPPLPPELSFDQLRRIRTNRERARQIREARAKQLSRPVPLLGLSFSHIWADPAASRPQDFAVDLAYDD